MQLEVSDSEEPLNITGDNLSGDEYAERPAVMHLSMLSPRGGGSGKGWGF